MQLDFTQFLSKIERMAPISVKGLTGDREYVESYVKAYYMPEGIMEEWIQSHSVRVKIHSDLNRISINFKYYKFQEYSAKQLISLINCAWQGNKKSKQRLQSIVEELDKVRR